MSAPPKDTPVSEFWLKLSSSERPSKECDFPRKGEEGGSVGRIRMRVLTQGEQMASTAAAEALVRRVLKDAAPGTLGYEKLFCDALAIEILFRACLAPKQDGGSIYPAFDSPKEMRSTLTTAEVLILFAEYLATEAILSFLPENENETDQ